MRQLVFSILCLFFSVQLHAQVKFTSLEFANGLKYPNAVFTAEPAIQDSINKIIKARVADLEPSDFCVGDFGYVQKGSHLQIHMMCNCIDMASTEHRYIFINLTTGLEVPFEDIFEDKVRERALAIISRSIANRSLANDACNEQFNSLGTVPTWEQLSIRLSKDGIEIRPANTDLCEVKPVKVTYAELSEYFKYKFL
jgi:hypothetical protein